MKINYEDFLTYVLYMILFIIVITIIFNFRKKEKIKKELITTQAIQKRLPIPQPFNLENFENNNSILDISTNPRNDELNLYILDSNGIILFEDLETVRLPTNLKIIRICATDNYLFGIDSFGRLLYKKNEGIRDDWEDLRGLFNCKQGLEKYSDGELNKLCEKEKVLVPNDENNLVFKLQKLLKVLTDIIQTEDGVEYNGLTRNLIDEISEDYTTINVKQIKIIDIVADNEEEDTIYVKIGININGLYFENEVEDIKKIIDSCFSIYKISYVNNHNYFKHIKLDNPKNNLFNREINFRDNNFKLSHIPSSLNPNERITQVLIGKVLSLKNNNNQNEETSEYHDYEDVKCFAFNKKYLFFYKIQAENIETLNNIYYINHYDKNPDNFLLDVINDQAKSNRLYEELFKDRTTNDLFLKTINVVVSNLSTISFLPPKKFTLVEINDDHVIVEFEEPADKTIRTSNGGIKSYDFSIKLLDENYQILSNKPQYNISFDKNTLIQNNYFVNDKLIKIVLPLEKFSSDNKLNIYRITLNAIYTLNNYKSKSVNISNLSDSPGYSFTLNSNIEELSEVLRLGREVLQQENNRNAVENGRLINDTQGYIDYLSKQIGGYPDNLINQIQSISSMEEIISRLGKIKLNIT